MSFIYFKKEHALLH